MIREILVQLKRGSRGAHLIFMFNDGKDRKVVSKATKRIVLQHEMVGGDEVLQVHLHPTNQIYRIKYEDKKDYIDPDNDYNKELARLFRTGQYQTLVVKKVGKDGVYEYDGNPYLQVHQFNFIDETQNRIQNVVTQKKLNRAIAIVDSLNVAQQKEILFHFNQDPTDMQASDIWSRLINFSSGIVLSRDRYDSIDTPNGKQSRSYLEYFVDEYAKKFADEESEVYIKTLILKALIVKKDDQRSILERKPTGYHLGEKFLGDELTNVINFLRSNQKEREHIKTLVAKYDEIPNNDIPELLKTRGIKVENDMPVELKKDDYVDAALQSLRRKIRDARDSFRMNVSEDISVEDLDAKMAEARKIWLGGKWLKLPQYLKENPDSDYETIKEWCKAERLKIATKKKEPEGQQV